mgnify:CR=1 FL=1
MKYRRYRATGRPIEQFDSMYDRRLGALADLHRAPNVTGGNDLRFEPVNIGHLAIAQLIRDFRLKDIICAL